MASLCIGGWLFAGKMRATDSLTMLDPFQKHYGCWMGVLLSVPAVSGELCWTASILYALGSTVETIVSIHAGLSIVVSAVVILFYTSLGGLFSVVYCDSFQIICTTVGLWTCVPFILTNKAVGQIGSDQGDWVGRIQLMDVPQLLDISAMTVFGGIPWQVTKNIELSIRGWLFAGKMRATDSLTMLDPFQKHYGCWMGVLLSVPAVSGELCWTASILYALGSTVETIVSIHAGLSIVVSAVVILFYTSLGGLFSVVYCDSFQIICTTVGLWTCVPFILTNKAVGQIGSDQGDWVGRIQLMDVPQLLDISAMTVFGGIPWQVYFQRVLSCKSVVNAKLLSFFTAMACFFLTIPAALIGAASKTASTKHLSVRINS
ncbi:uncharacterized protein ISCGN_008352 [Ixodes scapularis]